MRKEIELLAPAKNVATGIEAIKHGADAVYIGASQFGARVAAANEVEELRELTTFAHLYGARVYVTINTVLQDEDLAQAEALIWKLYEVGVDALIVQDMAVMTMNLPPIELHASTQTDNRTVEKVQFLQDAGFSQVVLARELSLNQIKQIAQQTDVDLEVFIHGALCVSYSGQCYISQSFTQRSANKGACAQYCRLPYDLVDANGRVHARGKHLLSLKDLNQTAALEQLLDAGATSLKIEGRLKDVGYVKNIVAHYRKQLDAIMKRRSEFKRASSGYSTYTFEPNPAKSFNRGFTDYYLSGTRKQPVHNPDSPKSMGEEVGFVKEIRKGSFTVAGVVALHNGDGLCYRNEQGMLQGFRVNRVEDNRVFPAEWPDLLPKTKLYRNFDQEFDKVLQKESAVRKIAVSVALHNTPTSVVLTLQDADEYEVSISRDMTLELAKSDQSENQRKQLAKMGNTPFEAKEVTVSLDAPYFIASSLLSDMRREACEALQEKRLSGYQRRVRKAVTQKPVCPVSNLSYLGNVTNKQARQFYLDHGVKQVDWGFEVTAQNNQALMFTKHCVKYAMGWCKKLQNPTQTPQEPLYLVYKDTQLRLEFDCKRCEMQVYRHDA